MNNIFDFDFTDDDGNSWTLKLFPGDDEDFSSPATVDFPFFTIGKDIILKSGLNEGFPLGLELAKTLEFSIDMNQLVGTFSSVDMQDVQRVILNNGGLTPKEIVINSVSYYYIIPNRWQLLKGSTIYFDGFQNPVPENEFNIDIANNEIEYKITCTDFMTTMLKAVKTRQVYGYLPAARQTEDYLIYLEYETSPFKFIYGKVNERLQYNLCYLSDIYTALDSVIFSDLAPAFSRGEQTAYVYNYTVREFELDSDFGNEYTGDTSGLLIGMSVSGSNIPADTVITGFKTSVDGFITNNDNEAGAGTIEITAGGYPYPQANGHYYETTKLRTQLLGDQANDLYFISDVVRNEDSKKVAGIFYPYGESLNDYPNMYDFINDELRANGMKGISKYYNLFGGGELPMLSFYKMFDGTNLKTISLDNITDGTYRIVTNTSYIQSCSTFVKPTSLGSQTEYTYKNDFNNGNDNSLELNPYFDTCLFRIDEEQMDNGEKGLGYQARDTYQNKMFYYDTNSIFFTNAPNKLHFYFRKFLGQNYKTDEFTAHTDEDDFWGRVVAAAPTPNTSEFKKNYNIWLNSYSDRTGTYLLSKRLLEIYNKNNIITFECEADTMYFDYRDVGDRVTIDLTDFEFQNLVLDVYGTNGIITECEQDVIKCTNKMKVLIYE